MDARNRRRQQQLQEQRQREGQRRLRRQSRGLTPASELSVSGGRLGVVSSNSNSNNNALAQRKPLMTIDVNTRHVPSSAMSTITTPTVLDGHVVPHHHHQQQQQGQENIPPITTTTSMSRTGRQQPPTVVTPALVSPDGPLHDRHPATTDEAGGSAFGNTLTRARTAAAAQQQPSRRSRILSVSPDMADLMSTEYSDDDSDDLVVTDTENENNFHGNNVYNDINDEDDYNDQDLDDDEDDDDDSVQSMLSTALSVAGIDLQDTRTHTTRHGNSRNNPPHPASSQIDELKVRLAETATQLTTAEDELRQRVEIEGSLRFAVDVLRKRLHIRKASGNKSTSKPLDDEDDEEEVQSVQEMLADLGLRGPPSQQAARIAREMEDSDLRTEGLRARLAKSEQQRTHAESQLRERNATVSELRAEIEVVRSKLHIAERRGEKDRMKLERRCHTLEASRRELKEELERFKNQLELVADIKPSGEGAAAAAAASGANQQALVLTPSAEEQETLEARAKAKVLLSLRKEADFTYKGAVQDLEAMISQVYAKELKAEIDAATEEGVKAAAAAGGLRQSEMTQKLSELSTQRIDEVGKDFKLLLSTRDRMLKLHEKIKKQCDSILSMSDTSKEVEAGRWDVAAQVHPVLPGAC